MSCAIERELQRMQAEHSEEHLPLEHLLQILHDEEVNPPPFFRRIDVPTLAARFTPQFSS
jgi:hypothetical protein